jgi:oligopeptide transport system substrate-binding protein
MKFKKFRLLLLAGVAMILVAACGSQASEGEGDSVDKVVNYVAPQELSTLDSTMVNDMNSANYIGQFSEGLYWEDSENNTHPGLAADMPTVSKDGLTYTIPVKEDAYWSNGDQITAHDFVFAARRLADPEMAATYQYLTENFVNAQEVWTGDLPVEDLGIKALDDFTVEIQLTQPTPYLINLLAFTPFYPLNQDFVESQGEDYGTTSDTVIASGPFLLEDWEGTGLDWVLNKNPDYYRADDIALDQVNVQVLKEITTNVSLYESGDVDNSLLTGELVKQYRDHPDAVQHPKANTTYLSFNYEQEYLQNKDLRLALDYVIDNDELTETVLGDGSNPAATFIPRNFMANPETGEDFVSEVNIEGKLDLAKGQEHWEKAQEALGTSELTLTLLGSDEEKDKKMAEYIQGQVQNNLPGLNIEVQNITAKGKTSRLNEGDFDITISGWYADFANGINFFDILQTGATYNRGHYSNETYDDVVEAMKTTDANDEAKMWEDFVEAQEILTKDAAIVPMYQEVETQLRNPQLKDLTLRPVGNEIDFRTAHFEAVE